MCTILLWNISGMQKAYRELYNKDLWSTIQPSAGEREAAPLPRCPFLISFSHMPEVGCTLHRVFIIPLCWNIFS